MRLADEAAYFEAYEAGNLAVSEEHDDAPIEKSWVTVGDARVTDECRKNATQGWIAADKAFSSGHSRPLAHMACRCMLSQRLKVKAGETWEL